MADDGQMEGKEVWVAETWGAHGDGARVHGVYSSREAAWDGLKGEVETLYVDERGHLRGRPRDEEQPWRPGRWVRPTWAMASPRMVQGRKRPALRLRQGVHGPKPNGPSASMISGGVSHVSEIIRAD